MLAAIWIDIYIALFYSNWALKAVFMTAIIHSIVYHCLSAFSNIHTPMSASGLTQGSVSSPRMLQHALQFIRDYLIVSLQEKVVGKRHKQIRHTWRLATHASLKGIIHWCLWSSSWNLCDYKKNTKHCRPYLISHFPACSFGFICFNNKISFIHFHVLNIDFIGKKTW